MMYTTFAYNSNEMRVSELITNISYFELLGNYIWIIVNKLFITYGIIIYY